MKKVLERLILSDLSEANDPFYLERNQIQAILYFGDGGMFSEDIKLYYRAALKDGSLSPEMLKDGIDFLRESLRAGRRVLAVGPTGATIVAAYLSEMGMSIQQAMEMVAQSSPVRVDTGRLSEHQQELQRRSSTTLAHR
ncbi:hypothetical protein GC173_07000 [bacterium]|nr:hypothetical protein [bacterium]